MTAPAHDAYRATRRPGWAGRHESDPLPDIAQGRLGDLGRRAAGPAQHLAQLVWSVEPLEGAFADAVTNVDHDLGDVLLEVAVALAGVLLLEVVDGVPVSDRGW